MNKIKLAVIFGGKSSEYPVSLHSAGSLINALNKDKYDIVYIGISKDGEWFLFNGSVEEIEHDHWLEGDVTPCILSCSTKDKGFLKLKNDGTYEKFSVDCIFPVLHGKNGEDGTIQGLFELSGIPYVGCDHMSSAICMDKDIEHIVAESAGIPCAPYMCIRATKDMDYAAIFETAKAKLQLPIFIKPANAGSSFGIHKVDNLEDFIEGCKDAFYHDGRGKVILETTIEGFEIGCAVMGNQEIFAGSVDEIETSAPFFDYEGKYQMVDSAIYCPARIDEELFETARTLAKKIYHALNCKGLARVDMFVTKDRRIIFNEANTIPGFTGTSRYPSMMKEAGIPFTELLDKLILLALDR